MNFVFISPNYPSGHWKYVSALRNAGVNVLCIGDAGDETFPAILRGSMNEYYRVGDLHDYEAVYRACAYFIHKYGRIDCIESLNPYWRDLEAELRFDYGIEGLRKEQLRVILNTKKSLECASDCGVNVTPFEKLSSIAGAKRFASKFGYPIVAKPVENKRLETLCITEETQLEQLLKRKAKDGYLLCAVPQGEYISCDGIANDSNEAIICSISEFAEPPEKVASEKSLLAFWSATKNEVLANITDRLLKAYDQGSGFYHFSFIKLASSLEGVGEKGEYVFVEAQFNPPAEYVMDAMCCAAGKDIFEMWAKLKTEGNTESCSASGSVAGYASRRFDRSYKNHHEKILCRLGAKLQTHMRTVGADSDVTGDYVYVFKGGSKAEIMRYIRYIQEDFASPKIPPRAEACKAVKKTDFALKKASKID